MTYNDLHAHIEGTISAKTLVKLVTKYKTNDNLVPDDFNDYQKEIINAIFKKIDKNLKEEEIVEYLVSMLELDSPTKNLMDFIIRLPTKFIKNYVRSIEDLEFILNETLDQYNDFNKVEFFFCPVALENQWLSDDKIIETISIFWQNHPNKDKFGFVLSLRRTESDLSLEYVKKVASTYSKYFDKGIPKLDICANEDAVTYPELSEQLDILLTSKQELTLHLGETTDRDIDYILDNYPSIKQYNHGIQGAFNENTLKKMKANNIFLTICPLSNLYTGVLNSADIIDCITKFKKAGIRYTIASDDATIINGDVKAPYKYLEENAIDLIPNS